MTNETATTPMFERVAIFGVGLLGGSLGMACRQRGLAREVIGIGRHERRLVLAQNMGAIDAFYTDFARGARGADLIVMATPVRTIVDSLTLARQCADPQCLITDVGSSKGAIVRAAAQAFGDSSLRFVGSHPMAGSERTGVANAREDLYEGAPCYVTPTGDTPAEALARLKDFWTRLGCEVTVMDAESHDRLVALLSHLPHAVAVALIAALDDAGLERDDVRRLTGPGLLDTTRIAAGSTDMWRDIFMENRTQALAAIDVFSSALARVRAAIDAGDAGALETILDDARALRSYLGDAGGGADETA